jgi:hypothetical protein
MDNDGKTADGVFRSGMRLVVELYLSPGDQHLFVDARLRSYDKGAATLLKQRVLRFLDSAWWTVTADLVEPQGLKPNSFSALCPDTKHESRAP